MAVSASIMVVTPKIEQDCINFDHQTDAMSRNNLSNN